MNICYIVLASYIARIVWLKIKRRSDVDFCNLDFRHSHDVNYIPPFHEVTGKDFLALMLKAY